MTKIQFDGRGRWSLVTNDETEISGTHSECMHTFRADHPLQYEEWMRAQKGAERVAIRAASLDDGCHDDSAATAIHYPEYGFEANT